MSKQALFSLMLMIVCFHQSKASTNSQNRIRTGEINNDSLLLGRKLFGTHWIEPYGRAYIKKNGNDIVVNAKQASGQEYCELQGKISVQSDRSFTVKGMIKLKVKAWDYDSIQNKQLNFFEDTVLKGNFLFYRHGKRKYWRLQQPKKPTGFFKYAYHYIDIYMN